MCAHQKNHPTFTLAALTLLLCLTCLFSPAGASSDAFSNSVNWLGEIIVTDDVWTCNATAGANVQTHNTDNYTNTASVRFKFKANKGYYGGSFMSTYKLYVGGVLQSTNSCNTDCTNHTSHPFTSNKGNTTYTVKLTTDVSGSWTILGQGISRSCSANSGNMTFTINRKPCPSTVAINAITNKNMDTQSIYITGTVTDDGCGSTVAANSCVKITVKAPDSTSTSSGWRNVSGGGFGWTYNFPSPKLPKHYGTYTVTATYDGSNNNHPLESGDSDAETFKLQSKVSVPTPPICGNSLTCASAREMHIVDDDTSSIYLWEWPDLTIQDTVSLNLASLSVTGVAAWDPTFTCNADFIVAQESSSTLLVYERAGGTPIDTIATPVSNPAGLTMDSQGYLWVADRNAGSTWYLIDPDSGATIDSMTPIIDMTGDIAWDETTSTLLAMSDSAPTIYRLDPSSGATLEEIALDSANYKTLAVLDGGIYLGDYVTGEFFFWDQGDEPNCLVDFQLHSDLGPNSISLSWTPDFDPNVWDHVRIYHNGQLLDTVPYYVKVYPHAVTPYSHHRYYLAAYNETEDLEGCQTNLLEAYAGLTQLPQNSTCQELKDAGMVFPADLNDDCIADLPDFALLAAQWLWDLDYPAPPSDLIAYVDGADIELEWLENAEPDLDGYNVYRAETHNGPYLLIAEMLIANAHTDDTVEPGPTYYYVVTAVDTAGNESNYSDEASAGL